MEAKEVRETSKEPKAVEEDDSSKSEEESSYDEEESERRKVKCLDDIQYLEQQFCNLKELLYHEKIQEIEQKIQYLNEGSAPEYLQPVKELQQTLQDRLERTGLQTKCRVRNIHNRHDEEVKAAHYNFEEMHKLLMVRTRTELLEKICKLEGETMRVKPGNGHPDRKRHSKTVSEFLLPEKKKKPVMVTGPCVVYMLREGDISEDICDIRRGMLMLQVQKCSNRDLV